MALEDLEDQMEELEEAVDREGSGTGSGRGGADGGTFGGGFFGFIRKIALWAAMFAVVGILAYFLLNPYGGKGTSFDLTTKTHEFGEQNINLQDGKTGLRVNVVVEVNDPRCLGDVTASDSMLMDRVIEILSRKTVGDIDSVVKRNRLKRELMDDFNLEMDLDNGRLIEVFFKEFFYFNLNSGLNN